MPTQAGSQTERRPLETRLSRNFAGWPMAAAICLLAGIACGLASPGLAAGFGPNPNLTLICPSGGLGEPQFGDPKTGKIFLIADPQLKAAAVKACNPLLLGGASSSVN